MTLTLNDIKYKCLEDGRVTLPKGQELNFCLDCFLLNPPIFMVHDELWEQASGNQEKIMLCYGCTEKRIGRLILPSDLTDAPCNDTADKMDQRLDLLLPVLAENGAL